MSAYDTILPWNVFSVDYIKSFVWKRQQTPMTAICLIIKCVPVPPELPYLGG
jgi:hypothetical protein